MKLTLEQADIAEPEVIIRGNLTDPQIAQIIAALGTPHTVSRLFLYREEKEYLCAVSDILYFESMCGKVLAHTEQDTLETKYKLYELGEMLRSSGFVQINKGVIVNVHAVKSIQSEFSGNYIAALKNRKTLSISRKYFKTFRDYVMKEL